MRVSRRARVSVERTSRTRFTLQELADLVELCARRDMAPGTRVQLFVDGREVRDFRMEVTGEAEEV